MRLAAGVFEGDPTAVVRKRLCWGSSIYSHYRCHYNECYVTCLSFAVCPKCKGLAVAVPIGVVCDSKHECDMGQIGDVTG